MGVAQRAYMRGESNYPSGPRMPVRYWSMTRWLIIANVAAFVLNLPAGGQLSDFGRFTPALAVRELQLWRWLTFQFLHADPMHLLFNMLFLYAFGPIVEGRLDRARFAIFYLICGVAGAAAFVLLWRLGILVGSPDSSLVGSSAGIFGLATASAVIDPHRIFRFLWPPVSLTLRTMVLIYIGFAVLQVVTGGDNAGGEASHLGGAVAGFCLIRNQPRASRISFVRRKRQRFWKPGDPAENFFRRDV